MLPMEEFDAPEAVRADFETLMNSGAPGGRFAGVDAPQLETTEHDTGERLRAVLRVPEAATYFDDHFPRRPVYPGTLLMDNLSTLALQLAGELPALQGSRLAVARVRDVKIRSFTAPGQALELEAHVQSASADGAQMKLAARADGRTIATARIDVERSH
jgi:3-hydroxyacyl-[acyl-carrier-protein] dehydratase